LRRERKVARDRYMTDLHARFPVYGFAKHMGYPTAEHLKALQEQGPCPEHRRTFGPVSQLLLL
jgi:ribonuclease HII